VPWWKGISLKRDRDQTSGEKERARRLIEKGKVIDNKKPKEHPGNHQGRMGLLPRKS